MFMVTMTSRKIISSKFGENGVQPKIMLYPDSSLNRSCYSEVKVYANLSYDINITFLIYHILFYMPILTLSLPKVREVKLSFRFHVIRLS